MTHSADPGPRPPLDAAKLTATLGWDDLHLQVVAETGSTNADLAAAALDAAPAWTVRVADLQTAGRGRHERTWSSPSRAGLTFSVLLRPDDVPLARWTWFPLLAGVAVCDALRELGVRAYSLKWPNDVRVAGRKLGGILTQAAPGAVVIGMGLNIDTTRAELPGQAATSLALEAPDLHLDRAEVLVAVLRALRAVLHLDAAEQRRRYLAVCDTIGQPVLVTPVSGPAYPAVAVDVDERGALVLDAEDGRHSLSAGDVETVRPRVAPR